MSEGKSITIEAPFTTKKLDSLPRETFVEHLRLSAPLVGDKKFLLTAESAERLNHVAGIKNLTLWCDVSRAALRHIARIPAMETVQVWDIRGPGKVSGLEQAMDLHTVVLTITHRLSSSDIRGFLHVRKLRSFSLQSANISQKLVGELAELPEIRELDLEATKFDDAMAESIKSSATLQNLSVGASRITRTGLRHLAEMKHLRELDLWACGLSVDDLSELEALPNLEYLSFGSPREPSPIDSEALIAALARLPSLKRIWLDGVDMTPAQVAHLEERYEKARIDPPG